ncbi:hypothetical protein MIR68_003481 [Amoeboaphelidium protococcarum]|nr:hypothetical protein MIR68_003481 [Amoeboaphelidium protococcarum]
MDQAQQQNENKENRSKLPTLMQKQKLNNVTVPKAFSFATDKVRHDRKALPPQDACLEFKPEHKSLQSILSNHGIEKKKVPHVRHQRTDAISVGSRLAGSTDNGVPLHRRETLAVKPRRLVPLPHTDHHEKSDTTIKQSNGYTRQEPANSAKVLPRFHGTDTNDQQSESGSSSLQSASNDKPFSKLERRISLHFKKKRAQQDGHSNVSGDDNASSVVSVEQAMSRTIVELSRTPSRQLKNKDKWQKLLPCVDPQFDEDIVLSNECNGNSYNDEEQVQNSDLEQDYFNSDDPLLSPGQMREDEAQSVIESLSQRIQSRTAQKVGSNTSVVQDESTEVLKQQVSNVDKSAPAVNVYDQPTPKAKLTQIDIARISSLSQIKVPSPPTPLILVNRQSQDNEDNNILASLPVSFLKQQLPDISEQEDVPKPLLSKQEQIELIKRESDDLTLNLQALNILKDSNSLRNTAGNLIKNDDDDENYPQYMLKKVKLKDLKKNHHDMFGAVYPKQLIVDSNGNRRKLDKEYHKQQAAQCMQEDDTCQIFFDSNAANRQLQYVQNGVEDSAEIADDLDESYGSVMGDEEFDSQGKYRFFATPKLDDMSWELRVKSLSSPDEQDGELQVDKSFQGDSAQFNSHIDQSFDRNEDNDDLQEEYLKMDEIERFLMGELQ